MVVFLHQRVCACEVLIDRAKFHRVPFIIQNNSKLQRHSGEFVKCVYAKYFTRWEPDRSRIYYIMALCQTMSWAIPPNSPSTNVWTNRPIQVVFHHYYLCGFCVPLYTGAILLHRLISPELWTLPLPYTTGSATILLPNHRKRRLFHSGRWLLAGSRLDSPLPTL